MRRFFLRFKIWLYGEYRLHTIDVLKDCVIANYATTDQRIIFYGVASKEGKSKIAAMRETFDMYGLMYSHDQTMTVNCFGNRVILRVVPEYYANYGE